VTLPRDLGRDGRSLLRRVIAVYDEHNLEPEAHERVILTEAARVADRLAQLRAALAGVELTEVAAVRLLAEERQQRVALSTLLVSRLGLPTGLGGEQPAATPRGRRAQQAANTRWAAHYRRRSDYGA